MILTRKSHNCAGTAFVQGDSAGGSKLVEQTLPCSTNFPDKLPFVNSRKSLMFDLTKILLPKRLVLTYSLIGKVMHQGSIYWGGGGGGASPRKVS